jgi:hypothetical protein
MGLSAALGRTSDGAHACAHGAATGLGRRGSPALPGGAHPGCKLAGGGLGRAGVAYIWRRLPFALVVRPSSLPGTQYLKVSFLDTEVTRDEQTRVAAMNKHALQFVAEFTETTALELLNDSVYVGGGSLVYVRHRGRVKRVARRSSPQLEVLPAVRFSATDVGCCRYRYRLRSALVSAAPGVQSYCALPANHKASNLGSFAAAAAAASARQRSVVRINAGRTTTGEPSQRSSAHFGQRRGTLPEPDRFGSGVRHLLIATPGRRTTCLGCRLPSSTVRRSPPRQPYPAYPRFPACAHLLGTAPPTPTCWRTAPSCGC